MSKRGRIFDSVISDSVFTPEQYANIYLNYKGLNPASTIDDLRKYMDNHHLGGIWDYPLTEITEVMECETRAVLVVDCDDSARWFEIVLE